MRRCFSAFASADASAAAARFFAAWCATGVAVAGCPRESSSSRSSLSSPAFGCAVLVAVAVRAVAGTTAELPVGLKLMPALVAAAGIGGSVGADKSRSAKSDFGGGLSPGETEIELGSGLEIERR